MPKVYRNACSHWGYPLILQCLERTMPPENPVRRSTPLKRRPIPPEHPSIPGGSPPGRASLYFCTSSRTISSFRSNPLTKPIKHVEKAVAVAANAAWFVYDKLNSINPNPSFTPQVVGQAVAQKLGKAKAETRLAPRNRFALPQVHP